MSADLERELRGAFADLPGPGADVTARARAASLPPQRGHGRRRIVVAAAAVAAWSPDGLKIAYVVRTRRGAQLRLIEGDGDHDRLLDARVAPAKPAWRHDSLRIGYVRANGRSATFDLADGMRTTGRVAI